ncbi:GPR endopeptidase [Limnochorda pilosa]|uniref:Germination protein n=1 Tax=Limnochorda pilosa TaxID=1555112 RepID=A0A0K2SNC3_LIMPI|nr:GPR endopeptidase [Limnochorda pilosa]BAS28502.1 germination protein [Limnochorda pilosa]
MSVADDALRRLLEEAETWEALSDLALEAHQVLVKEEEPPEIPGVTVDTQEQDGVTLSRVFIESEEGARRMGKLPGHYSTLEAPELRSRSVEAEEKVGQVLAQELQRFFQGLGVGSEDEALVVGLGNWNATPDSLGPKVVGRLTITRHLHRMVPPEKRGGMRPVAAIAPGVLGLTGIETSEVIQALVDRLNPKLVICIDALAARESRRLGITIQVADTGIHPGSGVGNRRRGITPQSLGIPVLAVGVPTVVRALTLVEDGLSQMGQPTGRVAERLLAPYLNSMIVTPREVDDLVESLANVVAGGLNVALHPALDMDEVLSYLS